MQPGWLRFEEADALASGEHYQSFEERKDEVLRMIASLGDVARNRGVAKAQDRLDDAEQQLRDGRLVVAVCGEFNRGKSMLLSALLGDLELLPSGVANPTSVLTTVTYAETESFAVTLVDAEGHGTVRAIERAEVAGYVTESGNPGNELGVRALAIGLPNPLLSGGLTFVDTPGFAAIYQQHTAVTSAFLPHADVIVFVTGADQPLSGSELAFLQDVTDADRMAGSRGRLIVVVTKTDLEPDYQEVVEQARERIEAAAGCRPGELTVVPVSSLARLDYAASGDPEDQALSNFAEFEQRLWQVLDDGRSRVVLRSARAELDFIAEMLRLPVQTALDALQARPNEHWADLDEGLRAQELALSGLADGSSPQWKQLDDALGALGDRLRVTVSTGFDRIAGERLAAYLADAAYRGNPDALLNRVVREVGLVVGAANELADRESAVAQRDFAGRVGLSPSAQPVRPLSTPQADADQMMKPKAAGKGAGSDREARAGGGGRRSGSVAEELGRLVGSALGVLLAVGVWGVGNTDSRLVPTFRQIGAELGGRIGPGLQAALMRVWSRHRSAADEARLRADVTASVAGLLDQFRQSLDADIDVAIADLRHSTRDNLRQQAQLKWESLANARAQIQAAQLDEAARAADPERVAQIAQLRADLAALDAVQARIAALAHDDAVASQGTVHDAEPDR